VALVVSAEDSEAAKFRNVSVSKSAGLESRNSQSPRGERTAAAGTPAIRKTPVEGCTAGAACECANSNFTWAVPVRLDTRKGNDPKDLSTNHAK
jgi:hypothetical protein